MRSRRRCLRPGRAVPQDIRARPRGAVECGSWQAPAATERQRGDVRRAASRRARARSYRARAASAGDRTPHVHAAASRWLRRLPTRTLRRSWTQRTRRRGSAPIRRRRRAWSVGRLPHVRSPMRGASSLLLLFPPASSAVRPDPRASGSARGRPHRVPQALSRHAAAPRDRIRIRHLRGRMRGPRAGGRHEDRMTGRAPSIARAPSRDAADGAARTPVRSLHGPRGRRSSRAPPG